MYMHIGTLIPYRFDFGNHIIESVHYKLRRILSENIFFPQAYSPPAATAAVTREGIMI